jgi:excisionase family DNA binding protein
MIPQNAVRAEVMRVAWFTVSEAAERLNKSDDTIRRRIKAGTLTAREGEGGRQEVELPDTPEPQREEPSAPLAEALRDNAALREALAASERRGDELAALLATAQDRAASDAEERRELRLLLRDSQAQVAALIPKLPAPETAQDRSDAAAQPQRRWWWPW